MKFSTQKWTYEKILDYISEEEIAMFYLGVNSNSTFYSFFRDENNPGKYLYYKNGRMQYYDCVESRSLPYLIMELNHWSYIDFIDHLKQDFLQVNKTIHLVKKQPKKDNIKHTEIKIKSRNWEDYDLEYWQQFGISKEILEKFNVKPISYYWVNNFLNTAFKYHYSYNFYWESGSFRRKLYAPFEKEKKWQSNGGKICQGESMLPYEGDLLIITKSLKDVMCLYSMNYIAIAPPSEVSFLPESYFYKQKERFKRIVIFFDNDKTGLDKAKKFAEMYDLEYIFIPKENEKDISDYRKEHGEEKAKELLINLLRNNII